MSPGVRIIHTPWKLGDDNCGGGTNIVDSRGVVVLHTARVKGVGIDLVSDADARMYAEIIVGAVNAWAKK